MRSADSKAADAAPEPWKLRFAPHLGFASVEQPFFKETVGSIDPVEQIRYVASLGFAGIDDYYFKARPVRQQELMGSAMARLGLEFGSFGNHLGPAMPPWGSREPDTRSQLKRDLLDSIEAAKRVNGRLLNVVAGRDLRLPLALQLSNMTQNLRELSDIAEKAGVALTLEQTSESRVPGMLLHRILDAYFIAKAVDSPAVRLVFDVVHVQVMDGDLINNLSRVWDMVSMIQIGDNPGRCEPGTGEINLVNVLRAVKEKDYAGLVVLEHHMSRPGIEGERLALAALRQVNAGLQS